MAPFHDDHRGYSSTGPTKPWRAPYQQEAHGAQRRHGEYHDLHRPIVPLEEAALAVAVVAAIVVSRFKRTLAIPTTLGMAHRLCCTGQGEAMIADPPRRVHGGLSVSLLWIRGYLALLIPPACGRRGDSHSCRPEPTCLSWLIVRSLQRLGIVLYGLPDSGPRQTSASPASITARSMSFPSRKIVLSSRL
jgi:hypothetical protein